MAAELSTGTVSATEDDGAAGIGTATEPFWVARSAAELSLFSSAVWLASDAFRSLSLAGLRAVFTGLTSDLALSASLDAVFDVSPAAGAAS